MRKLSLPHRAEGNAFFEDIVGRVHEAGVNIAQLLEGKEIGRVLGVPEHIRAGPINGNGAGIF